MKLSVAAITLAAMVLTVAAQDPEASEVFELAPPAPDIPDMDDMGDGGFADMSDDPCAMPGVCDADAGCRVEDGEAVCFSDGENFDEDPCAEPGVCDADSGCEVIEGEAVCIDGGNADDCGPVCLIFCEFGNVQDELGCDICECKPNPDCEVVDCSDAPFCPLFFEDDAEGCPTCNCFEPKCPEECTENYYDGCNVFSCAEDGTMTLIGPEIACEDAGPGNNPEPECRPAE